MLESELEAACRRYAQKRGWIFLKIEKRKGWPDRLLLGPQGQHAFVELKRPGEVPRPLQAYNIEVLNEMRHTATWIDNKEALVELMNRLSGSRRITSSED